MDIIIAGGGQVGLTMARQLAAEGHNLTIIDENTAVLEEAVQRYDALGICGNCASREVLEQAKIAETELVIASTNADEVNLLCCMTAHGMNPKVHTIARIRNPEYSDQVLTMPEVFPISLTVNPEKRAAMEIEQLLKFPGFLRRDSFAKGRTQIVELRVEPGSKLAGVALMDLSSIVKCKVLVCAVLRSGTAVAPSGNFVLREGDRIFVTAPTDNLAALLKNLGILTRRVRSVLICGGGRISYYLAKLLEKDKIAVTVLEKDYDRCLTLAKQLPDTSVIHGDCANHSILEDQGIADCDAVVTLTDTDETNMVISMFAGSRGVPQIITKLSHGANIPMGDTILMGQQAIDFVRYRENVGDSLNISRMERQVDYIEAFFPALQSKLEQDKSFVMQTYEQAADYIVTDTSATVLTSMLERYGDYTLEEVVSLEGENKKGEEFMEFYPDEAALNRLVLDLFYAPK